jgi:hypothetical protein
MPAIRRLARCPQAPQILRITLWYGARRSCGFIRRVRAGQSSLQRKHVHYLALCFAGKVDGNEGVTGITQFADLSCQIGCRCALEAGVAGSDVFGQPVELPVRSNNAVNG